MGFVSSPIRFLKGIFFSGVSFEFVQKSLALSGHLTLMSFRSEYGILLGKIGIGFGMSCDGSILGQVGRRTKPSERSRTFAMCFAMRQFGLISFPGFMLLFK